MAEFSNPRKVAERIRMATKSLADPHDIAVVRQYIYELEAIARKQELKDARATMTQEIIGYQEGSQPEDGCSAEGSGQIVPLARPPLNGNLKLVSEVGERPCKWILKLDGIPSSD
ncbi:hypothetical protein [Erythrobacter sp. QSSC1-22B]|uniref:hypothetical protein n=1 Tax=Erythrobacter sp. QSSC1-22B TaxID=1860125 RepID=UPI0011A800EB|nr:hypothetical protein [Erythrobacter sp. QSSC1-22B]